MSGKELVKLVRCLTFPGLTTIEISWTRGRITSSCCL